MATGTESVDWKSFARLNDDKRESFLRELLSKSIVSLERNGNYQVMDVTYGVLLSPRVLGGILYFTRPGDAADYAQWRFARAQYTVTVEKIEQFYKVGGK